MWRSRCSPLLFLSFCCLVLWPTVSATDIAPNPIDYSTVTSTVVDLLRVRLSWSTPCCNITSYQINYCTEAPSCVLVNVNVTDVMVSGGVTSYTLRHDAPLNTNINVNISAIHDTTSGGPGNGPVSIPVATYVDARVVNIRPTVSTTSFMIVGWDNPSTVQGEGINISSYEIECCGGYRTIAANMAVLLNSDAKSPFTGSITVTVTPLYIVPAVADSSNVAATSSPIPIPQQDEVLMSGTMPTLSSDTPTRVTINWQPASETRFLQSYRVDWTGTPLVQVESRRKRQSSMSTTVEAGATSAEINTCAYCVVMVTVNAVYNGSSVQLLDSATITTAESTPSAPRDLQVTPNGGTSLRASWRVPNPTNGIIIDYAVSFYEASMPENTTRRESVGSNDTYYIISGLQRLTTYVVFVEASTTAGDGDRSNNVTQMTVGVTKPTISVSEQTVTFMVTRTDGEVGIYQIVVSTSKITNTAANTSIPAYSQDSSNLYVTRVGTIGTAETSVSVDIGTGQRTQSGGVTYVDQGLRSDTDYYVYVRVFSSINTMVFGDSDVTGPVRGRPGVNAAAIAVPIVVVYVIIMIIVVVVILLCWFLVRPAYKMRKEYQLRRKQGVPPPGSEALVERKSAPAGEGGEGGEGDVEKVSPSEDPEDTTVQIEVEKVAD